MNRSDQYFGALEPLFPPGAADVLAASHVLVVGIGGVGSWVVEALARSGVGRLTLCDLDEICTTNINRQVHSLTNKVGLPKTQVMAERCQLINPEVNVEIIDDYLTKDNYRDILARGYDFVVDAIDQGIIKANLIAHCWYTKQAFITCGGAGGLPNPTGLVIDDLNRTYGDPLLRFVKNWLIDHLGLPKQSRKWRIPAVYIPDLLNLIRQNRQIMGQSASCKPPAGRLDCSAFTGSAVAVTGSMGFMAASYVINRLLANGLSKDLPYLDLRRTSPKRCRS